MLTLELTNEEVKALVSLLDMATKAGGLQVAKAAVHFLDKLEKSLEDEEADPSQVIL